MKPPLEEQAGLVYYVCIVWRCGTCAGGCGPRPSRSPSPAPGRWTRWAARPAPQKRPVSADAQCLLGRSTESLRRGRRRRAPDPVRARANSGGARRVVAPAVEQPGRRGAGLRNGRDPPEEGGATGADHRHLHSLAVGPFAAPAARDDAQLVGQGAVSLRGITRGVAGERGKCIGGGQASGDNGVVS